MTAAAVPTRIQTRILGVRTRLVRVRVRPRVVRVDVEGIHRRRLLDEDEGALLSRPMRHRLGHLLSEEEEAVSEWILARLRHRRFLLFLDEGTSIRDRPLLPLLLD